MRNFLIAGTTGLLIALGAASGANAANPNVPTYSPYTLVQTDAPVPAVVRSGEPIMAADQIERQAVFVDDSYGARHAAFPFNVLPSNW
jgi:hypothetical protein